MPPNVADCAPQPRRPFADGAGLSRPTITEWSYCVAAFGREVSQEGKEMFDLTPPPPDPRERAEGEPKQKRVPATPT